MCLLISWEPYQLECHQLLRQGHWNSTPKVRPACLTMWDDFCPIDSSNCTSPNKTAHTTSLSNSLLDPTSSGSARFHKGSTGHGVLSSVFFAALVFPCSFWMSVKFHFLILVPLHVAFLECSHFKQYILLKFLQLSQRSAWKADEWPHTFSRSKWATLCSFASQLTFLFF